MNDERSPIELSRRLVYLAAERTLTSWIRAELLLMALGFVIFRFELVLDLMPVASSCRYVRQQTDRIVPSEQCQGCDPAGRSFRCSVATPADGKGRR